MKPAVIKNDAQYRESMARIEELAAVDPVPSSREGAELELLALLVEDYERKRYVFERPDPVEAVQFRMLEQDLRQADLVPYFGSRSRVSEFLSRQRPLTVNMIRDLSNGLGISADILVQETVTPALEAKERVSAEIDWTKFPVKEMVSRGWIAVDKRRSSATKAYEAVRVFVERALGDAQPGVLARRTIKGDAFSWDAIYALTAWQARVLEKAGRSREKSQARFSYDKINEAFFRDLIALSRFDNGPSRAIEFLDCAGIALVVEEHLAKTKLDGAAMLSSSGMPVIGLTLRFDRIDNFWFTLIHELVHVWKHLSNPGDVFLDRLVDKESTEKLEKEANRYARDLLIPRPAWKSASVRQMPTKGGIVAFAEEIGIHPAIVAGRIQKESGNYAVFADMVGKGKVRSQLLSALK
ncbi:MAG: hypothetical protein C3F08_00355 [Candidatus Methylomirabilota bacterium]|nr:MAG: hypothetical protein C3F08_00355 [candidate division NC10 bacterium]